MYSPVTFQTHLVCVYQNIMFKSLVRLKFLKTVQLNSQAMNINYRRFVILLGKEIKQLFLSVKCMLQAPHQHVTCGTNGWAMGMVDCSVMFVKDCQLSNNVMFWA